MIEVEKTITNLFLIKDKPEHQAIIELTKKHGLTNFEILTIKNEPPYLVNNCADLEKVSTWQEFGIADPGFSRFWLDEYKEIDEIINFELVKNKKYKNEIIQSPYFNFDMVWHFRRQALSSGGWKRE